MLWNFSEQTEGARTRKRSQLQPSSWTTIPVLVKIFKVLINELSNEIENASAANQSIEVSKLIIISDFLKNFRVSTNF